MKKAVFLLCALVLTFALAGCEANADVKGDVSDGKIGASADVEAGTDANKDMEKDKKAAGTNDGAAEDKTLTDENGTITGTAADNSKEHKVGTSINRAAGASPGDPSSSIKDYWFTSRAPLN